MSSKWPYVAAMLDGEGSICLHVGKQIKGSEYSIQIVIYNSSLRLMQWLVGNFGGKFYTRTRQASSKRTQYCWHPSGKKNRELFILGVLPYMIIKRRQAEIALEFLRLGYGTQDRRKELVDECQRLNRTEESVETNTQEGVVFIPEWGPPKIESELHGDMQSAPDVNQGFDWAALQQLRKI